MKHHYILPFYSGQATLERVGGKGANLAELTRYGFPVPPGFLITTDGYRAMVEGNDLQARILARVQTIQAERPDSLDAASSEIRAWFEAAMPRELEQEIERAYTALGRQNHSAMPAVAVRSSATAEDLPGLSFAGQQDTFLNCVGIESVLGAVKKCWSSLWTARAIAYRARNGIPADEVALAVLVQIMIAAEVSGVLFTANPLTGRRSETVIDASIGLGQAIVSGQVEPDHYVVNRRTWEIREKRIGEKALAIIPRAGGGTEWIERADSKQQALPDAKILELARLSQRVADHYGIPQDIEWALADDRLTLLQARPITSLYPLPQPAIPDQFRVYFSFGAAQGVLDPLTPLAIDTFRNLFRHGRAWLGVGDVGERAFAEAGMRVFLDITTPLGDPRLRRLILGALQNALTTGYGTLVSLLDDPRLPKREVVSPRFARRALSFFAPLLRRAFALALHPEAERTKSLERIQARIAEVQVRARATRDLNTRLDFIESEFTQLLPHVIRNVLPTVIPGIAGFILARHWDETGSSASLQLMRGLPHNPTTEMDLDLWARAQRLRADAESAHALAENSAPDLAAEYWRGALPTVMQREVAGFLARYGMRGVAEIDIGRPRWRDDPTPIFNLLKSYLSLDQPEFAPDALFARGAQEAEQAARTLLAHVRKQRSGWLKARILAAAIRRVRALAGMREWPKFAAMQYFGIFRHLFQQSGRELAASGVLAAADDIFFLRYAELRQLDKLDARTLVAQRRAEYERERLRRRVPDVMTSEGDAYYGSAPDAGMTDLVGEAVSPGVVEGAVRVVLDPHGTRLVPGEILVCPATDPGWTPLFLTAGGLVTEVGGMITHGSVVAREYGIPAVVGVHEATQRLHTGQRVRVDGNRGRVSILDGNSDDAASS